MGDLEGVTNQQSVKVVTSKLQKIPSVKSKSKPNTKVNPEDGSFETNPERVVARVNESVDLETVPSVQRETPDIDIAENTNPQGIRVAPLKGLPPLSSLPPLLANLPPLPLNPPPPIAKNRGKNKLSSLGFPTNSTSVVLQPIPPSAPLAPTHVENVVDSSILSSTDPTSLAFATSNNFERQESQKKSSLGQSARDLAHQTNATTIESTTKEKTSEDHVVVEMSQEVNDPLYTNQSEKYADNDDFVAVTSSKRLRFCQPKFYCIAFYVLLMFDIIAFSILFSMNLVSFNGFTGTSLFNSTSGANNMIDTEKSSSFSKITTTTTTFTKSTTNGPLIVPVTPTVTIGTVPVIYPVSPTLPASAIAISSSLNLLTSTTWKTQSVSTTSSAPTCVPSNQGPYYNVSTFAGSGSALRVDGQRLSASFYNPRGVCLDIQGNVFVAENSAIRKIDSTGNVITVNTLG